MQKLYSQTVAEMNDEFRQSGANVVMTAGVSRLSNLKGLIYVVRHFNRWSAYDDRVGEHNLGHFTWNGKIVFWKIDYQHGGQPCWQNQLLHDCERVLTIMLASEY